MITTIKTWLKSPFSWLFFGWVILDYLSKIWAAVSRVNVSVIPNFFYLRYARNTGAAWSIFSGQLLLLALLSGVVGVIFFWYYFKQYETFHRFQHLAINLFLAGTWGNFIDRAFYEEGVIDFLSFQFGSYIFPTFNVADIGLTISVIGLIIFSFFEKEKTSV